MTEANAFQILAQTATNPGPRYHPAAVAAGWLKLKDLSGHPLTPTQEARLGLAPQPRDTDYASTMARISNRVRPIAARKGNTRPAPLILRNPIS